MQPAGGLSREFFSLLFKATKVFEGNTFSVDPQLLDSKRYRLIGKAVGKAIISGHPGPRCLNQHVTRYILQGLEPDFSKVKTNEICRADAVKAITDIEEATNETISEVFNEHISLLDATGYSKVLTFEKKEEAIRTLKAYYLLYRPMASINQFIEGLKIHGLFEILQQHPDEAASFFSERSFPSADEVQAFFIPVFSKIEEEKAEEEIIIYNWGKCLKNIEKGRISTPWLSLDTDQEEVVQLNIGHLLQALLGCPNLTPYLSSGLIKFDHESFDLPRINTCAPSITFSRIKQIQNYTAFQEAVLNVVVGAYGFGSA